MKLFLTILILLSFAMTSCSNLRKRESDDHRAETQDVVTDDDDFLANEDFDNEDLDEEEDVNDDFTKTEEVVYEDMDEFDDQNRVVASYAEGPGGTVSYTIQKNDTLMLISFKVYGDYSRWKEILSGNPSVSANGLIVGSSLTLRKPAQEFTWEPQGLPYIVQKGDTLGTISKDKYGTPKKWRSIYENNRPLIRDPNLIFAGFTLYYKSGESDMALNIH